MDQINSFFINIPEPDTRLCAPSVNKNFSITLNFLCRNYVHKPSIQLYIRILLLPKMVLSKQPISSAIKNANILKNLNTSNITFYCSNINKSSHGTNYPTAQSGFSNNEVLEGIHDNLQKVSNLIKRGFFSKAFNYLTSDYKPVTINDDVIDEVKKSFSTTQDILSDKIGNFATFTMELDTFNDSVNSLNSSSSGGLSGWSPLLVKLNKSHFDFQRFIMLLSNQMFSNDIIDSIGSSILQCRLSPFRKINGKLRCIGVTEVFYRIACICSIKYGRVDGDLLPYQFGVGSPGGVEPVIHLSNDWIKDNIDHIIIEEDISNAFGTISRKDIQEELFNLRSPLLKFFNFSHSQPTIYFMKHNNGSLIKIKQFNGTVQGSPVGPYFFSLGFKKHLIKIHNKIKSLDPNANITAYLDDVNLYSSSLHTDTLHTIMSNVLDKSSLKLNIDKKQIVSNLIFTKSNGNIINGCPIGTISFREKFIHQKYLELLKDFDKINLLPSIQDKQLLVRFCIAPKMSFFSRSINPFDISGNISPKIMERYSNIDELFFNFFVPFVASNSNRLSNTIIDFNALLFLPLKLGGFGIPSLHTIVPTAYQTSYEESMYYLHKIGFNTQSNLLNPQVTVVSNKPIDQKSRLFNNIYLPKYESIKSSIPEKYLSSFEDHSNSLSYAFLLTSPVPNNTLFTLSNSEFIFAITDRAFISPFDGRCLCNISNAEPGHDMNCKLTMPFRMQCHESLKTVFERAFQCCGSYVQREPMVSLFHFDKIDNTEDIDQVHDIANSNIVNKRADLLIMGGASSGPIPLAIDFSIASNFKSTPISLVKSLNKRFDSKILKYQRYFPNFLPVVLSPKGSFHPKSLEIFNNLITSGINVPNLKREIIFNILKIRSHSLSVMYKFAQKMSSSIDYSLSPLYFKPNFTDCSVNFINGCFKNNSSSSSRYSLRSSGVSSFLL